jgi:predicted dehydrogenase
MTRIGIVGSDNSHAIMFARIFNVGEASVDCVPADYRVTAIYGADPARTRQVADEGRIPLIVDDPADMLGQVDAVMVVFRHGDLHARYALPFIEAGIPTWVDKPFAIDVRDAVAMVDAAERHGTPLTGGSTLKHTWDVQALKRYIETTTIRSIAPLVAGTINYDTSLENEYGGIYFYGSHLAEVTMTLFGYEPRSVLATEHAGNVAAIVKYDTFYVVMNFLPKAKDKNRNNCYALVFGENGTIVRDLDQTTSDVGGTENFVRMLQTGRSPFPLPQLVMPVALMRATDISRRERREVALSEVL